MRARSSSCNPRAPRPAPRPPPPGRRPRRSARAPAREARAAHVRGRAGRRTSTRQRSSNCCTSSSSAVSSSVTTNCCTSGPRTPAARHAGVLHTPSDRRNGARRLTRTGGAARAQAAAPCQAWRRRARCPTATGRDARRGSSRRRARARAAPDDDLAQLARAASRSRQLAPLRRGPAARRTARSAHWPQSSTTTLSMTSVSDSSTALIVP